MFISLLILASVLFASGGLCMKLSQGLTRLVPSIGVFLLFGLGAACQSIAMKRSDMSIAYILVLGLEAILAFAFGVMFLGERPSLSRAGAVLLILSGIVWLERS